MPNTNRGAHGTDGGTQGVKNTQKQAGQDVGGQRHQQDDVTRGAGRNDPTGNATTDNSGDLRSGQGRPSGQSQQPGAKPGPDSGDRDMESSNSDDEPIRAGDVAVDGEPAVRHDVAAASEPSPTKGGPPLYPREVQPRSK